MSDMLSTFKSDFERTLEILNQEIFKYVAQLNRYDNDTENYERAFNRYHELLQTRGQLIEQQQQLVDIYLATVPHGIIHNNEIVYIPTKQNKSKKKHNDRYDAYADFINEINSPACAEMREIKEGFGFKKK